MDRGAAGPGRRAGEWTMTISVFLLDDHEPARPGLKTVFESEEDIEVVGEAGLVAEALVRIPQARPDVAILDVRLPDGQGVEVCREIRSTVEPAPACLMLTSYSDDDALFGAIMAGAAGYMLKQVSGRSLVDAVRPAAVGASLRHVHRRRGAPLDPELVQHRRHVVLHGLLRQEQPLRDLPVGQAFGDQVQHPPLLRAELLVPRVRGRDVLAAQLVHHRRGQRGVQQRAADGDRADRVDQRPAGHLLEHVPGRARHDRTEERVVVRIGREHQAGRRRRDGRADLAAHLDALAVRQPDVEDRDVRAGLRDPDQRLRHRARLAAHLAVLYGLEDGLQAGADQLVVVQQEHRDRHRPLPCSPARAGSSTVHSSREPPPSAATSSPVPPHRAARAARLARPQTRTRPGGGPVPSARTRWLSRRPAPSTVTSTEDDVAPAWRATFVSASRSAAIRSARTASGTAASSGPSNPTRGSKPSVSRASTATRSSSARRHPCACAGACSEKMLLRISRIVPSRSWAKPATRPPTAGSASSRLTPSSPSPVANSRWMTRSCRSRAIRSRSSNTASCWRASCARENSTASAACPAKVSAIWTSASVIGGLSRNFATTSTPSVSSPTSSGTEIAESRSLIIAGIGPARSRCSSCTWSP